MTRCKPDRPSNDKKRRWCDKAEEGLESSLPIDHGGNRTIQLFLVTTMVTDTEDRKLSEGSCE